MKTGPIPKPTVLKLLAGNPGRRKLNVDEPRPDVVAPECPDHLAGDAREEWDRIVPLLLKNNLLTDIDGAALALYCQSFGRWAEAERKLTDMRKNGGDGMLIKAPSGYPIINPYLSIAHRAMNDCYKHLQQFGLSPSSRTRAQASTPGESANGADDKKKSGAARFFT